MAKTKEDSPKAFLIYESTYNQLKKYFSPAQAGEFLMLMGEYMLYDNKDVESADPMVDMLLQVNKPILDAAEKRHKQAVENGMKGAESGKIGGAPKGNQNARKKKEEEKQPQNNPQSTPKQPLKKEIENNKEKQEENKIKNNININTNIKNNESLFSTTINNSGCFSSNVENGVIEGSNFSNFDKDDWLLSIELDDYGEPLIKSQGKHLHSPQAQSILHQVEWDAAQVARARKGMRIEENPRTLEDSSISAIKEVYGYSSEEKARCIWEDYISKAFSRMRTAQTA